MIEHPDKTKPLRTVKSFARRTRRMNPHQQVLFSKQWKTYGIDRNEANLISSKANFCNNNELVLEIGFGNGDSLYQMAKAHPECNYLGIEVYTAGALNLLKQLEQHPLPNLRIILADATEVLQNHIEDASLARIQIYFPDPWPKSRHHKRRLIQPNFLELVVKKLQSKGQIHLATDWAHYAEHMLEVLQSQPDLINQATSGTYIARPDYRPMTKFEQRGLQLGHGVWDLLYQKR